MQIQSSYRDIRVLILDDLPEMRSSLRTQVGTLGCEQVVTCGTVKDALEHCRGGKFDLILCDFYLAGGTDGQQFLEFLRTRNVIGRSVLFVMVTAEKGYENVVTAAECLPDDYLLKPFTAELLKIRLARLLEKKKRLLRVDQMQDKANWPEVISACDDIIASKDRYLIDAMRIKGNAMILAGRAEAAVAFYTQVLQMRVMPWAQLGLARALFKLGETARCKNALSDLISESPRLMAAYDLLGQVHMAEGDADAALGILDQARQISPNALARHRAIATVAEVKGDFARVEQALDQVVKKTRHSPLRETVDFARLGQALTEMGAADRAVTLLEEVRTAFKEDAHHPHLAAVEAVAQQKAGHADKAEAALKRALQGDVQQWPEAVALAVAKACLVNDKRDKAEEILKHLVQTHPEATDLHARVTAVLRAGGAHDMAEQLVGDSIREMIQLNNDAVLRAKAGDLTAASVMLTEAAQRLPGNMQIVANASAALLLEVYTLGPDPLKFRQAQNFQQAVLARQPNHPKLTEIAVLMQRIRAKYPATQLGSR